MINIGIWGKGFVGEATGNAFEALAKGNVNVFYYDINPKKGCSTISDKEGLILNSHFIFLCLPTPMKISGEISLRYLEGAIKEINDFPTNNEPIIIIKSTSVSGSTEKLSKLAPKLKFAFCPEFLTESNFIEDALSPTRIVIGADDPIVGEMIERLFRVAFRETPIIQMSIKEAETVKYLANINLFGQVMLSNELYFICEKLGVDYDKVQKTLSYDKRIGTHRKVPGPDGDHGSGGKCLIKDTNAFIYLAREHGYQPRVLDIMMALNDKVRKNKDWLDIPGATEDNDKFER